MGSKSERVITNEVIAVGDYFRNREVVQLCVDWLNEQMKEIPWDRLGISFSVNDAPKSSFEGDRPSFAIEVTGPKAYLGVDSMRSLDNRSECFMAGVRKAWGISLLLILFFSLTASAQVHAALPIQPLITPAVVQQQVRPALAVIPWRFAGAWTGHLGPQRIIVHLGPLCSLDSPDQGAYGITIDRVVYRDGTLTLRLPALGATWTGIEDGSGELTGTWTQRGVSAELNLTQEVRR